MKLFLLLLFFIFKSSIVLAIDTKAEQAIVFDWNTNEVLFEKNANQKSSPASMTKIMTIYAVFDRLINTDLTIDDTCFVSAKAYKTIGSRTFLEIDFVVTILS